MKKHYILFLDSGIGGLTTLSETLKNFKFNDSKHLEYDATSSTDFEKVSIELKINSESISSKKPNPKFSEELKIAKARIKRIKDYIKRMRKYGIKKFS